jgi:hypothetical protein
MQPEKLLPLRIDEAIGRMKVFSVDLLDPCVKRRC